MNPPRMRRWSVLVAGLIILALCASCSSKKENEPPPFPQDRPLYGINDDGVFYVHKSLVKAVEGKLVKVVSPVTRDRPRIMILSGDYYIYDTSDVSVEEQLFKYAYQDFPVEFRFDLGEAGEIPLSLVSEEDWYDADDIRKNSAGDVHFYMYPLNNPYLEHGPEAP